MSDAKVPEQARTRPGAGQVIGELLLTAGIVILLFVIYEAFWTNIVSGRLQDEVNNSLEESWGETPGATGDEPVPPLTPALGEGFARVHFPTLGAAYAVVEGTRNEDLRAGPGHYPDTQMPGEAGNFALAGHRNGSGAVFQHLDQLDACDAVVVETQSQWITYRLLPLDQTSPERRAAAAAESCLNPEQAARVSDGDYAHLLGRHITAPDDIDVVNPLPGTPWIEPDPALESMLTLTTCHPLFSNTERMIVHAVLVETISKSTGNLPTALQEQ
ncbi:class E sortase [Rhodococcus sp. WS3]|uniref:class E sortase n=1 Tax=unclassified Rhodococcus (in: high G+C Gram-positive bacteria) TaxID=192944 RepID=UPI0005D3789E|nr:MULTISPECIES: class E sortase [unclassified Rhodococcus (in: high G+C Gram-positive bacteria)]KJF19266.1 Sortase (surface protein transpeptidase) [Rhodococcus sp. AD45]ROZ42772.1 class E sortase [Rhodococcus sp. WS3]RZL21039.1 MAG: class E sortase [Rhodococcus sp. (in: high G+C Gram-positive bacteria)]